MASGPSSCAAGARPTSGRGARSWSRERFPEVVAGATHLPEGTVLDGELLAFRGEVLPFAGPPDAHRPPEAVTLHPRRRAGRPDGLRRAGGGRGRPARAAARPSGGRGWRRCWSARPAGPAAVAGGGGRAPGTNSPACGRRRARRNVEGLMLKRLTSPYRAGRRAATGGSGRSRRTRSTTVLIYAHPGHGRRASLFTDYTFAGLGRGRPDAGGSRLLRACRTREIAELDAWVRRHTAERFGPTARRGAHPGVRAGLRGHRSLLAPPVGRGRALPRILRWRKDQARGGGGHPGRREGFVNGPDCRRVSREGTSA